MPQVLRAMRVPTVRTAVVALTLSGLMVFGGTALARPAAHPRSVQPAATNVTVLGTKQLKQNASGPGATANLLSIGGFSTRAICTDLGSGGTKLEVQAKSTKAGTAVSAFNGQATISSSYHTVWTLTNTIGSSFSYPFEVMNKAGGFTHYDLLFAVNEFGADCVTHLSALSN